MSDRGPIARARARAAARSRAIVRDARTPTMKPGPGVTSARIAQLADDLGTPLEPWQRDVARRMFDGPRRTDGSPAVWPAPGWGRATR